ncbi:hypothetical protein [Clostridium cellulovorans]|uniref:Uncharacterized protein n=1 Tax=Clostridium cellulovorans (strain ATCC 35296 / DSM 3052 / OCM 3 / 743B) TaxID=573061 RepID=D9SSJ1_CLOC7|nr:hypothetical protein [Clostridium cellulovorans]ADL50588.1 hypothetical protein Clocel_0818 [Clostridium cellulovorans 743B]
MEKLIGEVKYLCREIILQVISIAIFYLLVYKINMNIYLVSIMGTAVFLTCNDIYNESSYMRSYYKFKVKDVILQYKYQIAIYLLELVAMFLVSNRIGLIQSKILYSIFLLTFNLYNTINLKMKIYAKWLAFIGVFPLIAMLIKGNTIGDMYVKNPLTMLGVVTGGITALITMLIFMVNFNVNDIYLGKSKSKVYLEDRVLIQFFKSRIFKSTFFVFLIVTLKLCGIVFKVTYIYQVLESIKLLSGLLDIIEKYYKNAGIFSFLILSLTILLAIMGNVEQLFHTMKFKEDEMRYLKRKIEQSIVRKYERLLYDKEDTKYFFEELTNEYKKIKEDEKGKFLEVVFNTNFNNYIDDFINKITGEKLDDFLNNKYNWIQENISIKEILEKRLLADVLSLSYLDKSKFNNFKVDLRYRINYFRENENDIRINLIDKFIKLEKQEAWEFIHSLIEEILRNNRLSKDTGFVKYVFEKVMRNFVKIDNLESNIVYKLLRENKYNEESEKLKNEVFILYLYDQKISDLERCKYKELLNLLSEEYKISWALYKIFEEKYKWSKDVEFAFEVLYETDLEKVESYYWDIIAGARKPKKRIEVLEIILSILDKSRLKYRMRNKYEFIFQNLKREINYEFEEILKKIDINIFKFILIRDWVNEDYISYYIEELKYFDEKIDNRVLINNIFNKFLLYVKYRVIEKNRHITELIYQLTRKYREVIVENIYHINDWKIIMYLENKIDNVFRIHFEANHKNIRNDSTLAYFSVLLDKNRYEELYSDKKFKKELYISLSEYMRIHNKTLEETIDKFKQYRNLSELEERVLKREIDYVLMV